MICRSESVTGALCGAWSKITIEVMPRQHRDSHRTAGNRGEYPHNGAERFDVCQACAEAILESEGDWAHVVERRGFDEGNAHHVSLTPLDVGFDPRRHDMAVQLPPDVEAVRYTDSEGATRFARGTPKALANVLIDAGYKVEITGGAS